MNIVLRSPDGPVSLLVDEIDDVADLPLNAFASVPDNIPVQQRNLLSCVYDLPEGLVLVLDVKRLLEQACDIPSDRIGQDPENHSAEYKH
jgi:purine-binding chemotaxis protein CheW